MPSYRGWQPAFAVTITAILFGMLHYCIEPQAGRSLSVPALTLLAQPWPWAPELFRVQRQVVEPRLESAVLRNQDAASVLAAARLEARDEL